MQNIIKIVNEELGSLISEKTAIVVRLYHKGTVAYEMKSGYSNLEFKTPANFETVFPVSSMTKQFTAAVIYYLEQNGLLSYQDNLKLFFPDMPKYGERITIKHLIHQTSGLRDPYIFYKNKNSETYNIKNKEIYEFIIEQKSLLFQPGEQFQYSNSNYVLLSLIAEKATNKKFAELLSELIFDRLNMNNSLLYDCRYVVKNRAYGYEKNEENEYLTTDVKWLSYGDGGIFCSLSDLEKWYLSLNKNLLTTNYSKDAFISGKNNNGEDVGYGFGWFVNKNDDFKLVYHLGGDPGYGSIISFIPEKEIGLIILANLDGTWKTFNNINKKIYKVMSNCEEESL